MLFGSASNRSRLKYIPPQWLLLLLLSAGCGAAPDVGSIDLGDESVKASVAVPLITHDHTPVHTHILSETIVNGTIVRVPHHSNAQHVIFFLFAALAFGALAREKLRDTAVPYTVVLLLMGILVGLASRHSGFVGTFTDISDIDPHLLLFAFLPILLFESTFAMDYHVFIRTIWSVLSLAVPGVLICTFLTAVVLKFILPHDEWSWATALLVGAILSATDPVAVVALLRELGASKSMATLIEGESLLNDGTSIVVFLQLLALVKEEQESDSASIDIAAAFGSFFYVVVVGPLTGIVMGALSVHWLGRVYNDNLVEITITLSSTYLTYYLAEEAFSSSGVLASVCFGLYVNHKGRTTISKQVEEFLHQFYEMLAYLANTLIFIVAGVICGEKVSFTGTDVAYLLVLYLFLHVARGMSLALLSPVLVRTGYGLDWGRAAVLVYSGLRGGVGLALGLIVQIELLDEQRADQILFYVAGTVVCTLVINGSTINLLLDYFGMSTPSPWKLMMLRQAERHLVKETNHRIQSIQNSTEDGVFLLEADWQLVQGYVLESEDEARASDQKLRGALHALNIQHKQTSLLGLHKTDSDGSSQNVSRSVNGHATKRSIDELTDAEREALKARQHSQRIEGGRTRFLRALKRSFWRQYEDGSLGHNAVLVLADLVDQQIDKGEGFYLDHWALDEFFDIPEWLTRYYAQYRQTPLIGGLLQGELTSRLFLAFHVGQGYVKAMDEVNKLLHVEKHDTQFRLISDPQIAREIHSKTCNLVWPVMQNLSKIRKDYPDVVVAVKTVFAANKLLNQQRKVISELSHHGSIEDDERTKLIDAVEKRSKVLHFQPPAPGNKEQDLHLLQKQDWLKGLSDEALAEVRSMVNKLSFDADEHIMQENQLSDSMLIVQHGHVEVTKKGVVGHIYRGGPGSVFGELSFIPGKRRTATVTATEFVSCFEFKQEVLLQVMAKFPQVRCRLWAAAARKIATTFLRSTSPYDKEISNHAVFVESGDFLNFEDDDMLPSAKRPFRIPALAMLVFGSIAYKQPGSRSSWSKVTAVQHPKMLHGPCIVRADWHTEAPKLILFTASRDGVRPPQTTTDDDVWLEDDASVQNDGERQGGLQFVRIDTNIERKRKLSLSREPSIASNSSAQSRGALPNSSHLDPPRMDEKSESRSETSPVYPYDRVPTAMLNRLDESALRELLKRKEDKKVLQAAHELNPNAASSPVSPHKTRGRRRRTEELKQGKTAHGDAVGGIPGAIPTGSPSDDYGGSPQDGEIVGASDTADHSGVATRRGVNVMSSDRLEHHVSHGKLVPRPPSIHRKSRIEHLMVSDDTVIHGQPPPLPSPSQSSAPVTPHSDSDQDTHDEAHTDSRRETAPIGSRRDPTRDSNRRATAPVETQQGVELPPVVLGGSHNTLGRAQKQEDKLEAFAFVQNTDQRQS